MAASSNPAASSTPVPVAPLQRADLPEAVGERFETDVIVVGYGCAGAAAALEAAAVGADVLLLERFSGGGGSSALSGGEIYLGGGTPVQKACGFNDTVEDMQAFLTAALGPAADEAKIREYSRGSLDHFDWLTGHGVPFNPSLWDSPTWVPPTDDGLMWMGEKAWPFCDIATPAPRGHRVAADGFGGKVLMAHLRAAVEASPRITVHTDTYAQRLILDGDRAAGVQARHFGDRRICLARRGVVLTTGGFADNKQMVALHAPRLAGLGVNSDGGDDGRGIAIAQAAGAAVKNMAAAQVGVTLIPGMAVRGMVVNDEGHRFINEDVYPGLIGQAALFRQQMRVWVILDEEGYEAVPEPERWGVRPHHVAETLEELERETGMPDGALQTTVGQYNLYAARGEDPYFHKAAEWLRPLRPPFAAIDVRRGMTSPEGGEAAGGSGGAEVFTTGGLHSDVDARVLDLDGNPIRGLFAAGRSTSGLHGGGYVSGTSLGPGTFFGRRAGRSAAAEN